MTTHQQILARLAKIRARADSATENWSAQALEELFCAGLREDKRLGSLLTLQFQGDQIKANATFAAHARMDVPALCDAAEKQANVIEEARAYFASRNLGSTADELYHQLTDALTSLLNQLPE